MNIPQVKLLKGTHPETGQTGQGCFMNVIAYLNNEPVITDQSECVCFTIRPLAIWANDWMTDEERPQLLPFILRAMGSRTHENAEMMRRLNLVVAFADQMAVYAAKYAKYAEYAATYAKSAEGRKQIMVSLLALFDAALPPLEKIDRQVIERMRTLEAMAA